MPYTSIFSQMKERAEQRVHDYWKIRTYYTECLMIIQRDASTVPLMAPDAQQYRAENQTWSYFCKFSTLADIPKPLYSRSMHLPITLQGLKKISWYRSTA